MIAAKLAALQPDYVVLDAVTGCRLDQTDFARALQDIVSAACAPEEEVDPLVRVNRAPPYGPQRLYACTWP
ncbi:MAG: hypothetical protein IT326_01020, partial [Anaerolineae bacterium]|nr:hypothetical protein [Anaerolineae bacterium]